MYVSTIIQFKFEPVSNRAFHYETGTDKKYSTYLLYHIEMHI